MILTISLIIYGLVAACYLGFKIGDLIGYLRGVDNAIAAAIEIMPEKQKHNIRLLHLRLLDPVSKQSQAPE